MLKTNSKATEDCRYLELFEETPLIVAVLTYLGYAVLIVVGHMRDFMRNWNIENVPMAAEPVKEVGPIGLTLHVLSYDYE